MTTTTAVTTCTPHHWTVEPADGPTSKGVYRHCGETRQCLNYMSTANAWSIAHEDRYAKH